MRYVTCSFCGLIHSACSFSQAIIDVESFNQQFDFLPPEKQKLYYDGNRLTIAVFTKCKNCGNSYHNFRVSDPFETIKMEKLPPKILYFTESIPDSTIQAQIG